MKEKTKCTILIISHQERILNIADQIILLEDGQIKRIGRKEDMMVDILGATLEGGFCGKIMEGGKN